jgi:hypothetical protein
MNRLVRPFRVRWVDDHGNNHEEIIMATCAIGAKRQVMGRYYCPSWGWADGAYTSWCSDHVCTARVVKEGAEG